MRTPSTLPPDVVRRLSAAPLTYAEVGATADPEPPAGYGGFTETARLAGSLEELGPRLLGWQVQLGAGLRVAVSPGPLREGTVVRMRLGPLPIPCRVVRVVEEPDRVGFAYGTLPGHPEQGEELFLLERAAPGAGAGCVLTVRAFARPATLLARLGGPVSHAVQRVATRRYLRALA